MKNFKIFTLIILIVTCCSNPNMLFGQKKKVINSHVKTISKKESVFEVECNEVGNVITDPGIASRMITNYRVAFCDEGSPRAIHALDQPSWLDLCLIQSIDQYLKSNVGKIDGIRFYFAAYETPDVIAFPRDKYQNRMTFILVPTKTDSTNGGNSKHVDLPSENIGLTSSCYPEFQFFNIDSGLFTRMKNKFGSLYRGETRPGDHSTSPEGKDKFSTSVWFSACLFDVLVKIAEKVDNSEIDGYRFYPAAYDKFDSNQHPGQKYTSQSTILIVPTIEKEDQWDVQLDLFKAATAGKTFNHGELCPDKCP